MYEVIFKFARGWMTINIQSYVKSKKAQESLYKQTLKIVVIAQILGGAGLAAGITVGALIAQDMLGSESYAGLPAALFTLGSALSAYLVGRFSQTYGRRIGLSSGFIVGGIGAIGVILATLFNNVIFLFLALFVYGAGTSTNLQARYAGSDLATEKQRGMAVSIAMVSTTLGAVVGPNLVTPMGKFASVLGIPELAGPFILAAVAYLAAGITFFIYLRPDPLLVAKAIAEEKRRSQLNKTGKTADIEETYNRLGVVVGALVLVISHFVMVAIMTMTPVHMKNHGTGLTAVGLVISLHIAAMYLPSLGTGVLVDRIGRMAMVIASGVTLMISGIMAAIVPGDSVVWLTVALILLGVGWNFGLISGTAIIIDSTTISIRARAQGAVDVWVAIGGTGASLLSGIIVAYSSYAFLGVVGMTMSLVLIPLIIWLRYRTKDDTPIKADKVS